MPDVHIPPIDICRRYYTERSVLQPASLLISTENKIIFTCREERVESSVADIGCRKHFCTNVFYFLLLIFSLSGDQRSGADVLGRCFGSCPSHSLDSEEVQ